MPTTVNKQILTFDTSVARPRNFQIFRGETVVIECALTNYINPIDLTGMTASAYWRSKAMAEESSDLWYSAEAEIVNGKVVWTWDTSSDDGSDDYEWFIKVTDASNLSYRAFGHIGMLGSPATNPSVGPIPQSNYYTKDETDAHISQATEHLVPDTREINGHALNADVNLTASDVGALPDTYVAPVTSVNGETGAVSLSASDVGALADTVVSSTPTNGVYLSNGKLGAAVNGPVTIDNDGMINLTSAFVSTATEPQVNSDWNASSGVAQILNKPTIPEVVAPTSEATTGQAADAEATWTSLSGLDENITQARIQMALEDGAFALPQTVVEFFGTIEEPNGAIVLLDLSGNVGYAELKTALDEVSPISPYGHFTGVKRITFGTNVSMLIIAPTYEYTYSGTTPANAHAVFQLVDDEQTVLAKQDYLDERFSGCVSIGLPLNLLDFGFDLGGSILDYTYQYGNTQITEYEIKPALFTGVTTIQQIAPFAFAGWMNCKRIVYPYSATLCIGPHFIDHCTNLEVLDLRNVTGFYNVQKQFKIGSRVKTFSYASEIANVNPNLKIVVSDAAYTDLMSRSPFTTWHPYLVKASDWEYVHHSELADYATSTDVATAISTATSGLVDQTELNTAISTATSGLATQTALTTAISAVEAEIPEVVSPYTDNASGKAADAQDTGNALKTKANTFQPYQIGNCVIVDNYWHQMRMYLDETNSIAIVYNGNGFVAFGWPDDTVQYDTSYDGFDDILSVTKDGTVYDYSVRYSVVATLKDIPAVEPETWTFTLEDGTVLTKSVAVY